MEKQQYIEEIAELMDNTSDIVLLDFILKLLQECA